MATKGKKISEVAEDNKLSQLDGTELVPMAKNGSNAVADVDTIKEYANEGLDDKYVAKEDGKELSSNDYTDEDKNKVDTLGNTYLQLNGGGTVKGNVNIVDGSFSVRASVSDGQAVPKYNFKDSNANNIGSVGVVLQDDILERVYIGWGSTPWTLNSSLSLSDNIFKYKNKDVLTEDNYSSIIFNGTSSQFLKADGSVDGTAYLPTNGGTISHNNFGPLKIKRNNDIGGTGIIFENNSGSIGVIGVGGIGSPIPNDVYFNDGTENGVDKKIWHEGNDGSGSGLDADLLDGKQGSEYCVNLTIESGNDLNNIAVSGIYRLATGVLNSPVTATVGCTLLNLVYDTNSRNQVFFDHSTNKTWYRYRITDGWKAWRQFAFTDSNVASADKLTTKQLTNEDLNIIRNTENYSVYFGPSDNTCLNKPNNVTWFSLQVLRAAGGAYNQVLIDNLNNIYKRTWNSSSWSSWQQLATTDGAVAKLITRELLNENLNDIKTVQFTSYYATGGNNCTNRPNGVDNFGLQVYGSSSQERYCQIITTNNGDIYKRCWAGAWSAWKKMLTEDDLSALAARVTALENK